MQQKITRAKLRVCPFCQDKIEPDYKDAEKMTSFLTERGKIVPRMKTYVCPKHQRRLSVSIKRARYMGLAPYTLSF